MFLVLFMENIVFPCKYNSFIYKSVRGSKLFTVFTSSLFSLDMEFKRVCLAVFQFNKKRLKSHDYINFVVAWQILCGCHSSNKKTSYF